MNTAILMQTLRTFKNSARHASRGTIIKNVLLWSLGIAMLIELYFGFLHLLSYIHSAPLLGPYLIFRLLVLIFVILGAMLIFSTLLVCFNTLFFSRDLDFLWTLPISQNQIFSAKFWQTFVYSSWMVVLTMLPFLAAYARVYKQGILFWSLAAGSILPYLVSIIAISVCVAVLVMRFLPAKRSRDVLIIVGVIAGSILYVAVRLMRPETIVRPEEQGLIQTYLDMLKMPDLWWSPAWWVSQGISYASHGDYNNYFGMLSQLALAATVAYFLMMLLGERYYYYGWSGAYGGGRVRVSKLWVIWVNVLVREKKPRILMKKDARVFFRDTQQWTQLLLLAALAFVYIFNLTALPEIPAQAKQMVAFFNLGAVEFIVAAVALRFIFPAIALEGKSWWLLRSMPVHIDNIFKEKFRLYYPPLIVVGLILVIGSNLILQADRMVMWLSVITCFFLTSGIACLAAGMGASNPRFNVENISKIETSPEGIWFIMYSLFYIGAALALETPVMRIHFIKAAGARISYVPTVLWVIPGLIILNLFVYILPVLRGKSALAKYDL